MPSSTFILKIQLTKRDLQDIAIYGTFLKIVSSWNRVMNLIRKSISILDDSRCEHLGGTGFNS